MTVPVTQSEVVDMTVPVTELEYEWQDGYEVLLTIPVLKASAPRPNDQRIRIIDLPEQFFGVISYSGFASDSNFEKHREKLQAVLLKDGLIVTGPPVKATYNSPFTPPFLRRNEAMYRLNGNSPHRHLVLISDKSFIKFTTIELLNCEICLWCGRGTRTPTA